MRHSQPPARPVRALWVLWLGLACLSAPAWARQVEGGHLSGTVVDAGNGRPVSGANVFVSGTMLGAATNAEGRFSIHGVSPGACEVVVSMVGYRSEATVVRVEPGGRVEGLTIRLHQAVIELEGVQVEGEMSQHWRRDLQRFEKLFLGESKNADETTILNPEVLSFDSPTTGTFIARASAPLELENRGLGYHVTFVLESFTLDPRDEVLSYSGRPFFRLLPPPDEKTGIEWAERREQAYLGSLQHLLFAMASDRVFEEGFLLFFDRIKENEGSYFFPTEYVDLRAVGVDEIVRPTSFEGQRELSFTEFIRVVYRKGRTRYRYTRDRRPQEQTSWIRLTTYSAVIFDDGYVWPKQALKTQGAIGDLRVADLLPREYGLERAGLTATNLAAIDTPEPVRPALQTELLRWRGRVIISHEASGPRAPVRAEVAEALDDLVAERWDSAEEKAQRLLQKDENDLEARYLAAIAHREQTVVFPEPSLRQTAAQRFASLVGRDSLFRDGLYQYALLFSETGDYDRALPLAVAQARLRPDLPHVIVGLDALYRRLAASLRLEDALARFPADGSAFEMLARADALRRGRRFEQADSLLSALLDRKDRIPDQPILLQTARLRYEQGRSLEAQALVEQAIDGIDSRLAAAFVFEDVKLILSDEELRMVRALDGPDALAAFFRTVWRKRDPAAGLAENLRMTEHYRRLAVAERDYAFDGARTWHTNPDTYGELDLPDVYWLNDSFNDKGLVYIRHGEPDERIVSVAPSTEGSMVRSETGIGGRMGDDMDFSRVREGPAGLLPSELRVDGPWLPNESWRYAAAGLDFHFVVVGGGNHWTLTPRFTNLGTLIDRESWGGEYAQLAHSARRFVELLDRWQLDRTADTDVTSVFAERQLSSQATEHRSLSDKFATTAAASVAEGLNTDRHTWDRTLKPLDVPFLPAAFADANGRTRLEIHFAMPNGLITRSRNTDDRPVSVELGLALHDPQWEPVLDQADTVTFPASDDPDNTVISRMAVVAPPDSYQVALDVRPLEAPYLAAYRFSLVLPDYGLPALALSDLIPAYHVSPGERPDAPYRIVANPYRRFSTDEPIYLYFEVYHLALDSDDRTRYRTRYTLTPVRGQRLLDRDDRPSLALEASHEGVDPSPVEVAEIDARQVAPGRYVLSAEISDVVSGLSVQRAVTVELVK